MKSTCMRIIGFVLLAVMCCSGTALAGGELNLYNWSIYINPEILTDFEKESGIKVNLDNYETNEQMLAKIQAGATGYDIVFPSVHMEDIMIKLDLLSKMDFKDLDTYKNIDSKYFIANEDPDREYCIPYQWGTTGLIYNIESTGGVKITSWDQIFNPPAELDGKISMLNDIREVIGAALVYNGFSINSTDPKELKVALETIKKAKPHWAAFINDGVAEKVVNGDIAVGQYWSGSAMQGALQKPDKVFYVIPKEGANKYQEMMCVLKTAPNKENALKFMEYYMRPEVAAKNTDWLLNGTTNKNAVELLDPKLKNNENAYPPEDVFARLQLLRDVGPAMELYDNVWTQVKSD